MSRFRLFLAWLIVAAIPLQGLAAASMLFCGTVGHHSPAQVAVAQADHGSHAAAAIEQHDHSRHSHAAQVEDQTTAGNADQQFPDGAHKCPVCASCCHGVAITGILHLAVTAPAPQAELAEPFVLIHARPSSVPDKPPRA
jgi:hypothetical protein